MFDNMRPSIDRIPAWCWEELSRELQEESAILHTRTTPDQLKKVYEDGFAVIKFQEVEPGSRDCAQTEIHGFFAAWPVADGFLEVGTVWVHKYLRGHGIGRQLYLALKELPAIQKCTTFGITTNPISVHLGHYMNLVSHTDWSHPVPWELTCGRCDKLAECDKATCPMRDTTCLLRVMKK